MYSITEGVSDTFEPVAPIATVTCILCSAYTTIRSYTNYAYMHAYIHTYMYIHTYVRTYVRTYIHAYMHACIHTYIHTYIHTSYTVHINMHNAFVYTYTCVNAKMARVYIHAYITRKNKERMDRKNKE